MEKIDATAKALEEAEKELTNRRNEAHELLSELKTLYNTAKQPIKDVFPLEQWQKFGLSDRR